MRETRTEGLTMRRTSRTFPFMQRDAAPTASGNRAVIRGLEVLSLLVDEHRPMSPTAIAERVGIHQSSVSRILASLGRAGYVRKTSGRRFTPDFGLLTLASAVHDFDLIRRPRRAMEEAASRCAGMMVSLGMLWRDHMIYFLRATKGVETVAFVGPGYPLHLSAPGLRILVDLPEAEALDVLRTSRERYGWAQPTPKVPATEEEVLATARALVSHDILILDGWAEPGNIGGAIPLATGEEAPVALSITAKDLPVEHTSLALMLHEIRHTVEESLY